MRFVVTMNTIISYNFFCCCALNLHIHTSSFLTTVTILSEIFKQNTRTQAYFESLSEKGERNDFFS